MKRVQVTLPKQGKSILEQDEWRQHMVDVLKVANMECQGIWNQLEGIQRVMEYLADLAYKRYTEGSKGSSEEQGKMGG